MAPIHDAARSGDLEAVKRIIESQPNAVDKPDSRLGWTPIHVAVIRNRVDVVKYLVEQGAWVDKANLNQLTPLLSAVQQHRNYEIVHSLVVDGEANVLQRDHNATPLLEIAERYQCDEAIMNLLRTHAEKAEAEIAAKKEEQKRKRAEAAAKRKAEREANGGKAPKKKKKGKAKKKTPSAAKKSDENEGENAEPAAALPPEGDKGESNEKGDEKENSEDNHAEPKNDSEEGKKADKIVNDNPSDGGDGYVENEVLEDDEPVPFLEEDNREVIGALKLMLVKGAFVVREQSVDHYLNTEDSEIENEDKVIEAAKKLTKQLVSWTPDQPAFAFYIPPDEAQAGRDAMEQAVADGATYMEEKATTGSVLAHGLLGVKDDGYKMEVKIKEVTQSRKTAWANRYYYSSGRIQSKILSKVKAATNALKAQTEKSSISEVKFYTEDRAWYWPSVLLVGDCKKVPGALFGIKFDCIDQEHLHHGR
mmetsp:Transcript_15684/g.23760  ORF Transcript_15684/g.23760 Transcript_15684/m.23760 type:complete len:477 (-) Transcript_15684:63-1493(-)